jgi:hypothetical protein
VYAVAKPNAVDNAPAVAATIKEFRNAVQTSGRAKAVSYQCNVKCPSGTVGNLSELKENTMLVTIGANTNPKSAVR